MSVFGKIKGAFASTARQEMCAHLQSLGIPAQIAERGRPEEKTRRSSLGLVQIPESPISWLNLYNYGDGEWAFVCGIPNSNLTYSHPRVSIRSTRVKEKPVFGKVIGVRWGGEDS